MLFFSSLSKRLLYERNTICDQGNTGSHESRATAEKAVERPAAARAIAEAREKGDLRENAEYDAAKEAQGILEAKIAQLEGQIATARIIEQSSVDTSKVSILTKVKLTNLSTKKQVTYQIVSEKEADLKAGKISVTSPIGKGLLGKTVGDVAEVSVPAGVMKFKVEDISI